jgi:LPS-assembly lipoprotein
MSPLGRRQVLALGLALSGCGFQPVYMPTATGKPGVAQREMAAIHVNLIPQRPGQELRQALQERLEMGATGVLPLYDLSVGYGVSGEGLAVLSDNNATRIRLIGTAAWTLTTHNPPKAKLTNGFAKALDGLNILDSQYFALDLENEAVQKRIAEALADQIAIQIAAYFRKRAAAAG